MSICFWSIDLCIKWKADRTKTNTADIARLATSIVGGGHCFTGSGDAPTRGVQIYELTSHTGPVKELLA